jgi:hypothetical protein
MRKSYELVKKAFATMRKRGYIARCGFMCCRSCAGCAIADEVEAMSEEKRAKVRGVVLFTKQDVEDIERRESIYVSFGPIGTQKFGDIGEDDLTVGKSLCAALAEHGVEYSWDGSGSTRIRIDLESTDVKIERAEMKVALAEQQRRAALAPMTVDVFAIVRFIFSTNPSARKFAAGTPERNAERDRILRYFAPEDRERLELVIDAFFAERDQVTP